MLLVKTKIGPSDIHGTGLFADEFIAKGTEIWKFQNGFDLKIDPSEMANLSDVGKNQFLNYSYLNEKTNKYVLCFDDARFFNHSEDPNVLETPSLEDEEGINIAGRDIQKGEELTCDYHVFDGEQSHLHF